MSGLLRLQQRALGRQKRTSVLLSGQLGELNGCRQDGGAISLGLKPRATGEQPFDLLGLPSCPLHFPDALDDPRKSVLSAIEATSKRYCMEHDHAGHVL